MKMCHNKQHICKQNSLVKMVLKERLGGGGVGLIPRSRLMSMCCWMRSNFHNWIDYYGVTFSYILRKIQGQDLGI